MSPEELRLVEQRRAQWHAARAVTSPGRELLPVALVAVAFVFVGLGLGNPAVVAGGGVVAGVVALIVALARRRSSPVRRGPWDAPAGGWTAVDTVVRARSVVGAASGDEDYEIWLLFEIPGDDWFFVAASALLAVVDDPAHEDLRLTTLAPGGMLLTGGVSGDPIARRGAGPSGAEYALAIDRGHVWRPQDEPWWGAHGGRVPEASLPDWVHDAARG